MATKKKKGKLPQSLRSAGKTGKRRARAKARERVIEKNKTPGRTKKTIKRIKEFAGEVIKTAVKTKTTGTDKQIENRKKRGTIGRTRKIYHV